MNEQKFLFEPETSKDYVVTIMPMWALVAIVIAGIITVGLLVLRFRRKQKPN